MTLHCTPTDPWCVPDKNAWHQGCMRQSHSLYWHRRLFLNPEILFSLLKRLTFSTWHYNAKNGLNMGTLEVSKKEKTLGEIPKCSTEIKVPTDDLWHQFFIHSLGFCKIFIQRPEAAYNLFSSSSSELSSYLVPRGFSSAGSFDRTTTAAVSDTSVHGD